MRPAFGHLQRECDSAFPLRLRVAAPNEDAGKELETGLAKLDQVVGPNAKDYAVIADVIQMKKQRDKEKERNRKFGLAVQAAIEAYLSSHNLHLDFVDNGYDYDVYVDDLPPIDAGTHHFKLADYLLEVKATTTGEVRLTPAQAQAASDNPAHFIICVVDLRGIAHEQMEVEWTGADVEPRTKIVTTIGSLASQPRGLVVQAKQCQVIPV